MQTTVFLANRRVQALQGRAGRRGSVIARVRQFELHRDCLVGGVIVDQPALAGELRAFWEREGLPRRDVRLVVDSGQFISRIIRAPHMSMANTLEVISREFGDLARPDDVLDYMQLRPRPDDGGDVLLCCGSPVSLLQSYRELFASLEVKLSSVTVSAACVAKLLEALPELADRVCVVLALDGDSLLGVIAENGRFKYSSHTRLLHPEGTPERAAEVAQTVSGFVQFQMTDHGSPRIGEVLFADCPPADLAACRDGIEALGLRFDRFPDSPRVHLRQEQVSLGRCLFAAGDFIVR